MILIQFEEIKKGNKMLICRKQSKTVPSLQHQTQYCGRIKSFGIEKIILKLFLRLQPLKSVQNRPFSSSVSQVIFTEF